MGFTSGFTAVTGATFTAAQYNTNVRDNLAALWPFTTAGDIAYAVSSSVLARVGIGTPGQVLTAGANAPTWGEGLPSGVVMDYAGASIPTGWLNCDGSAINRTTYANLFAAIGTTFGAGNGTTTFNLPDGRGRATIGVGTGTGLTARALGAAVGEETHILTTAELASHTHTQDAHNHSQNAHTHGYTAALVDQVNGAATGSQRNIPLNDTGYTTGSTTATNNAATATNQNAGSGSAHNTMQPSLALNKIIKI